MIEAWELVLHHTYSGTPRVVIDDSPGRQCHGVAINLTDDDFLADGAAPNSGAVRCHPDSMIRVPATKVLNEMSSVRVEVTFICDRPEGGDLVIGDSFGFGIGNGHLSAGWANVAGSFGGYTIGATGPPLAVGQWHTAGYFYDGFLSHGFTQNGQKVSDFRDEIHPLNPVGALRIGNRDVGQTGSPTVRKGFAGRIDDVKVWRLNPHYVDAAFQDRPTDTDTNDCWRQWRRALNAALSDGSECAAVVTDRIARAVAGVMHSAAASDDVAAQWEFAAQRYAEFWQADQLDQIVPVLVDLVSYLRGAGVDPTNDADVIALIHEPCFDEIRRKLPPLDCDQKFVSMLEHLEISL
ncbi:LamG domain-containing protein [Mycobacterium paraterrae]|uniref:LamG domain-containing protein n=1 Tax=Mycobacterium paraterrae TaxID=577492 RepID=A0ABY3VI80_9MYCO|nr:LamG domain-containing protein [Mycobacterium paraterrae]UMB69118.1 LamG domain-containing protein [Mycobacterium paraterrae]